MEDSRFTDDSRLLSVEFEVDGLVQGVYFRKYALSAASQRGLRGFVKNTRHGSIAGVLQGDKGQVADMKQWLYTVGSPEAVIQGCVFRNEREIINHEYEKFNVNPSDW